MAQTLEQKIAQKEQEVARLKEQARKLETGQKIIIGGVMLAKARKDAGFAEQLIADLQEMVTGKTDKKRIAPVIEKLQKQVNKAKRENQQHQPQHQPQHQNN